MIKVEQTEFWPLGNCFAACLASMVECDLAEVPALTEADAGDWDKSYWKRIGAWLDEIGWRFLYFQYAEPLKVTDALFWTPCELGPAVIVSGPGPRRDDDGEPIVHSVIMKDGRLVHDPHPDGGGLKGVTSVNVLWRDS